MALMLKLAWRNLWRHPRRTWLTTGAMVFSNVILVFMISMQVGMYQMMIDNTLRASTGHLQVQARGYLEDQKIREVVPQVKPLAKQLGGELDLDTVAPRAAAFALASSADRSYGIQIVGVEPMAELHVSSLPGLVVEGRFLEGSNTEEIVIGEVLARNLKAGVGDELTFMGAGRDGSFAAAVVTVVGILESGNPEMDRSLAQVPLAFFQDVFTMDGAGHDIVILAPDLFQVATVKSEVEALLPTDEDLVALDWEQLVPGLKQAIQADMSSAMFMYLVLIVLVAFSVLNTQLMSVLERTKEFGIVTALGVSPGRLGRLVLLEATLMGLMGLVIGVVLGGALVVWFSFYGFTFPGLDEMAGQFNLPDRIYLPVTLFGLLFGPSVVLLASILATLYPMARLRWLEPVDAMRAA
ncbi:MAG: FtsX-like permease family protein [Acidobacteria bacterium]|jgi:ABC-type lipoprotein release transport system permease subunit|nr:FtsX-like permease family protein [Acidobacteriota bacterium]